MTIEVQLTGSDTASCLMDGEQHSVTTTTRKGPIGPLLRGLRDAGKVSRDTEVLVTRDGRPVFGRLHAKRYLDWDVSESGSRSVCRVSYKPFKGIQ